MTKLDESITLETLVNNVDYNTLEDGYVPSKFALKMINFIKLVNGESGEENKSPVFHYAILDAVHSHNNVLAVVFRGGAKALSLDTEILTPDSYKLMRDIQVGDIVLDRNSKPTKVTNISKVYDNQAYKITLRNKDTFIANKDHLHIVEKRSTNGKWVEQVLNTEQLLEDLYYHKPKLSNKNTTGIEYKYYIPLIKNPIEFTKKNFTLDPYTVGLGLGDGCIKDSYICITSSDYDVEEVKSYIPYEKLKTIRDKRVEHGVNFCIKGIIKQWKELVGEYKREEKRIPKELLYGSIEQRLEVLQGLMDSDGTVDLRGHTSFCSISKHLAEGVHHIVKSLGGYSHICFSKNKYKGYYKVTFRLKEYCPFKLKRKINRWLLDNKPVKERIAIEKIELVEGIKTKCISVDSPTKSYLIKNSIITHNTSLMEYTLLNIATFGTLDGFGDVTVAMYVGDTMDNGCKNLRANIEHRYRNSEFLQKFIPKVKFTDVEIEFTNVEGHQFCVRMFGASTGVRGFKKYGQRPQLAILDDLMSDKSAESKTITNDIENVIYKAVRQAMHPTKRKVIWIGTPFNKKDPLYKAAGSKSWHTVTFPICQKFPCTKKEFIGAWEDRFPYEAIKNEYSVLKESGRVDAFNQELMLRILSDDDRLILDEDIIWYERDTVLNNIGQYNIYMTTDFATSETEKSDFSVISVWALDYKGVFHWIDGIVKRQDMASNVDDVFRFIKLYRPLATGIEISGQQKGFVSWLKREMTIRGTYFNIASDKTSGEEGLRPNTSKLTRFNIAVPLFKQRKIAFPKDLKDSPAIQEFIDELTSVTPSGFKSAHDDCADTISQLPLIEYFNPIDPKYNKQASNSLINSGYNRYFTEPPEEYKSSYIV